MLDDTLDIRSQHLPYLRNERLPAVLLLFGQRRHELQHMANHRGSLGCSLLAQLRIGGAQDCGDLATGGASQRFAPFDDAGDGTRKRSRVAAGPLWETMALAVLGAIAGAKSRIPAGALLVPLFAGIALSCTHVMTITLPPWLMAGCYALVGWSIGLRFSREIVIYAARVFPKIAASTLTLIALCGGLAVLLHLIVGTDPLTAYLATSPGGADSVAIIAASSNVDVPFVMAMQMARFILVLLVGPALARAVARWTNS